METATRQALPDNRRLPSTTLGTPIFRNDQRQIQILIHRGKRYRPHPVTSFKGKVSTVGVASITLLFRVCLRLPLFLVWDAKNLIQVQ